MSTPMVIPRTLPRFIQPTLRNVTLAALLLNALLFVFDIIAGGPNDLSLGHIIPTLIVIAIVATRFRWTTALGALLGGLLLVDASVFLTDMLIQPDTAAAFAFAATFFATAIISLAAGIGATVQNYRGPRSRPFVDQHAPSWIYPTLLALAALVLGGILTTAIQPRGVAPSVSPDLLATLPVLQSKDYLFAQTEIRAKVGETVALRLDNADDTAHYLDIDAFNVHALMPSGKSNVAIFKPTQPGTYTFYCHPHADKAARTGMVGTLVVAP